MILTWLFTAALIAPGPTPTCGDGVIEGAEVCDDEGTEDGDGCSADCLMEEEGWTCTGQPSDCTAICGDGLVRGEECDDGDVDPGDGCSDTCVVEENWSCDTEEPSVCELGADCGDSMITGGEACDDGNEEPEDGCDDTCSVEPQFVCETPDGGGASVCLADDDEDTIINEYDNCVGVANPSQRDEDDDGIGDKCEPEVDDGCSASDGGAGVGVAFALVALLTLRRRRFVA